MSSGQLPIHGRGAADNPPNRFELLRYEPDPDADPADEPAPATQFFKDQSRSVIASNDSPDVGFEKSLNPYRGCEHGCVYCLSGDTPILMADATTRLLKNVHIGDEIYGTARQGWYRRYVKTRVLAHWQVREPAFGVKLKDGTLLITGPDHRFLTQRGWKFVAAKDQGYATRPHLTPNNKLMGVGGFAQPPLKDEHYLLGYLTGIIRGDALLAFYRYERKGCSHGNQYQFRLALVDDEGLERTAQYLLTFGISTNLFTFQRASPTGKALRAIRTHAQRNVERIHQLVGWPRSPTVSWCKGFLAGIFDAEGGFNDGVLRITNTDGRIIEQTCDSLERFGFTYVIESLTKSRKRPISIVRICGGLREQLRFFHTVEPAIARKRNIEGQAVKNSAHLGVVSVEPLGISLPLFDITTGTGDFIANGVVSHNCYARPTHEYLGFSAGLDFETKIMVKEDAPQLLRRELASPRWQPQTVSISGVTDPYQPIERRLQVTRRCLEVFAEFRNPVGIVTKNHLVTRDIDLLAELAKHEAAVAFISITSLDGDLARKLEPRATQPHGRLAAVEELSKAGVPVGVMTAPVIPGLNDHEIPAILDAAARAGARYAGYVMLRLPLAVEALFEGWLERHYPEKKDKVLSRIRDLRGGRLSDARFGSRMRGEGPLADLIKDVFALSCRKAGISGRGPALSTAAFRRPGAQPLLFE